MLTWWIPFIYATRNKSNPIYITIYISINVGAKYYNIVVLFLAMVEKCSWTLIFYIVHDMFYEMGPINF
jgi:hypothetical protein